MSSVKNGMTAEEIDAELERTTLEMEEKQINGEYIQAEHCRVRAQQLKRDYEVRRLYELKQKQNREKKELAETHNEQMNNFHQHCLEQEEKLREESQLMEKEMSDRHMDELAKTSAELDATLPKKLKESSELLNLRKMEEHMAKQRNYIQAHKVQEQCNKMLKQQIQAWNHARYLKIEAGMKKLKNKQEVELQALQLRYKTSFDELEKERIKETQRLELKYVNVCKQLKMQHDKEIICHKGQFKSKGGQATSPSMSRSKVLMKEE